MIVDVAVYTVGIMDDGPESVRTGVLKPVDSGFNGFVTAELIGTDSQAGIAFGDRPAAVFGVEILVNIKAIRIKAGDPERPGHMDFYACDGGWGHRLRRCRKWIALFRFLTIVGF